MIQRIQTVFLFLAAGAAFGLFGLPLAKTEAAMASSEIFQDQQFNLLDDTVMLSLFVAAGVIAFLAIFLFKNRVLQRNITFLSIFITVVAIGWSIFRFTQDPAAESGNIQYQLGLGLPVLIIIFAGLAARFIKKDDKLVKSMDRLR
jgi:hypothetical protein